MITLLLSALLKSTLKQALNLIQVKKPAILLVFLFTSSVLFGCSYLPFQAKPINQAAIVTKLVNRTPNSEDFQAYLLKQGYAKQPITKWGLQELTYCALFFNPTLAVAKAKWVASLATVESSKIKPNPSINGKMSHSNLKNGDNSPWAFGLGLDLPVDIANKREIQTALASNEAEIAKIDVALTAWQVQHQVAVLLTDYYESQALIALLNKESATQAAIINLLDKRLSLGMIDRREVNTAKLLQQKTMQMLNGIEARATETRGALASTVGLTSVEFDTLPIKPFNISASNSKNDQALKSALSNSAVSANNQPLQTTALLNRLDIRAGLIRYELAENQLKLAVAKQYPDITLSPSYTFEFGDSIWSLGIASLFNLLNKNSSLNASLINEATQLREVEAAQFVALQAKVIGDLSQALAAYSLANQQVAQAENLVQQQSVLDQSLQKQFDSGLIDRLALTSNQLIAINAAQNLVASQFKSLRAAYAIEDVMQHPLYTDPLLQ